MAEVIYPNKLVEYLDANHPGWRDVLTLENDGRGPRIPSWPAELGTKPTKTAVTAWTPSPVPAVQSMLIAREQVASETITRLKAKAAVALVMGGMSESDAYAAGSAFVVDHSPKIQAYILAGGNPVAGQALIDAVVAQAPAWWSPAMLALFEGELL